jgi:hypothetical protein
MSTERQSRLPQVIKAFLHKDGCRVADKPIKSALAHRAYPRLVPG